MRFAQMGEDWSVFNIILVILDFVRQDVQFFSTALSNDGTFTLILKLWARLVHAPPTSVTHRKGATMLFVDSLVILRAAGSLSSTRAQLLREVGGDASAIAVFAVRPLRDAAKISLSEFGNQASLLAPSIQLVHRLLDPVTGAADEQAIFERAFCGNLRTDPRPLMVKIVPKYTAACRGDDMPIGLRGIIRWSFQLCSTLLLHGDAINFILKLLDNGLLEAYANLVPSLNGFTDHEMKAAAALLKHDIATFLEHESVITASKNALHKLERERKSDYKALKETESGLKDAWRYFIGHALERIILKGIYDGTFRKMDKLRCELVRAFVCFSCASLTLF